MVSVWGTWLHFDVDDHADGCAKWVDQRPKGKREPIRAQYGDGHSMWLNNKIACSCGAGPIIYQGSHILPSDDDERGGSFEIGAIDTFIRRDGGYTEVGEETDRVHPWLRLCVNSETLVLDLAQVTALHATLTTWLERVEITE